MTTTNDNSGRVPVAPRGFFGTLADVLKSSNDRRPARRSGGSTGRPQPKRPCGGCGGGK